MIVLRSSTLVASLDRTTGALRGLVTASGGWTVLGEADAGLGFSVRIPLPGRRHNLADSADQEPPTWDVREDESEATATWTSLRSRYGGVHDIGVQVTVAAVAERLVFTMTLDNRSDLEIEDVVFPWLGAVRPPDAARGLSAFSYRYAAGVRRSLWPVFDNVPGYYGVDRPTYLNEGEGTVGAPVAPFVLLEDGARGLCVAVDEPSSELVAWHAQLHPGYGDSLLHQAPSARLDPADLPEPPGVRFAVAHVPYVAPGERRRLTPVALTAYEGDWHAGADHYVRRRMSWMGEAQPPAWAADPHAWLQLHVNSPEDELRLRFDELPEVAASCVRHGVRVIQLVGWNDGGQDRNNPSHDADPRLGGPDALAVAIAACQAQGVRVVLFAKFTWADRSTERYRRELVGDAVKDPYGDPYLHPGYRYQTMAQLLDVSTRRLVPMCFASAHYRQVAEEEFAKLLDLGADGMLFDESLHHSPALLCFDTAHGHRRGHPVYAEDRELVRGFRRVAAGRDTAGRDASFLYAGEACYDWELEVYGLSYHRSDSPEHVPLSRYLRPRSQLMTAVTGFDDRGMVNQALMLRYLLSYEPYNFKGRLEDFPRTVAYGSAMDALRTELRAWFWDGEFRDTVGASVRTTDGGEHRAYAVFGHVDDGSPGVVVCNPDPVSTASVTVELDGGPVPLSYRLVGDDRGWQPAQPCVELPPRSAAVVVPTDRRGPAPARARSAPGPS